MKTRVSSNKPYYLLAIFVTLYALFGAVSCSLDPAAKKVLLTNAEKDLLAAGGALLISGGDGKAAIAALSSQELKNIESRQKVLDKAPVGSVQP